MGDLARFVFFGLGLASVSGCGGGGGSSGPPPPSTTDNTVVASVSPPPPIRQYTGPNGAVIGPVLIVVTFTTSDQRPASELQVTATQPAMNLPTWAGPGTRFRCASVSTGSGCAMNIAYQVPTVG